MKKFFWIQVEHPILSTFRLLLMLMSSATVQVGENTSLISLCSATLSSPLVGFIDFIYLSTTEWVVSGAGMTEKFFPIYFKEEYKFTPITVQYLYCGYGPFLAFCTHYQQIFAKKIGKIVPPFLRHII